MNFYLQQSANPFLVRYQQFFIFPFLLLCFYLFFNLDHQVWYIVQKSISDAYIQVSTFVAATLLFFYSLEKYFKLDVGTFLQKHPKFEIVTSSFLGALPGCGGAIMVITQYIRGKVSFGAVVATLTATMGDAAFLLIAKEPFVGLCVMIVGFVAGAFSGLIVNVIHNKNFLNLNNKEADLSNEKPLFNTSSSLDLCWIILFVPGIFIGLMTAFQIDLDSYFENHWINKPATLFGFIAGCLCFLMWFVPRICGFKYQISTNKERVIRRTVSDTNFVTGWVIMAFLAFELTIYFTDSNLASIFNAYIYYVPLFAVLIGFLPGCGPQILVTTMYLSGYIPLSAQLGNAIANDGDALFPAIAMHPKAAIIATIYSAFPALIVSYAYMFLIEIKFL